MKSIFLVLFTLLALNNDLNSQIYDAPLDKAVIYFTRVNALGAAFKFRLFDGDELITKIKAKSYFRYECSPGEHIFWAKAETTEYVDAILKPGKIYIIDVIPQMGLAIAGLRLQPVEPNEYNLKQILKVLSKPELRRPSKEQLVKWQSFNETQVIPNGLKGYIYNKERDKVPFLNPEWFFELEELKRKKK